MSAKRGVESEEPLVEKKVRGEQCLVCFEPVDRIGKFYCKTSPDLHLICDSCGENVCRVKPRCPSNCGPLYTRIADGHEIPAPRLDPFVVKEVNDGIAVANNIGYLMQRWTEFEKYTRMYSSPKEYTNLLGRAIRGGNETFALATLKQFRDRHPVVFVNATRQGLLQLLEIPSLTTSFLSSIFKQFKHELIGQILDRQMPRMPHTQLRRHFLSLIRTWTLDSSTVENRVLCFLVVSNHSRAGLEDDLKLIDSQITEQWLLDNRGVVVRAPPSLVSELLPPELRKSIGLWAISNITNFDSQMPLSLSYFLNLYAPPTFLWPAIMRPMPSVSEPFLPHFTYYPAEGHHYYAPERVWRESPRMYKSISGNINKAMVTVAPIPETNEFTEVNYMLAIYDPEYWVSTVYVFQECSGHLDEHLEEGTRVGNGNFFVKKRFVLKVLGGFFPASFMNEP